MKKKRIEKRSNETKRKKIKNIHKFNFQKKNCLQFANNYSYLGILSRKNLNVLMRYFS